MIHSGRPPSPLDLRAARNRVHRDEGAGRRDEFENEISAGRDEIDGGST